MRRFNFLSPTTGYAVRFGTAVSAAIWLGKVPGLVSSHSSWILITVLVLMQPSAQGTMLKTLFRLIGTPAAAGSAILLFGLYSQDPPQLMAAFFAIQAIAAYGYSGSRFQYAWFVWGFTTAIVLGDALAGEGAVETVAFERASMVAIGAVLVFVVDALSMTVWSEPQPQESPAPPQPFWPVRLDPIRMKIGIRTGIAVTLTMLIQLVLGWPVDTLVAPVAFMVAVSPTRNSLFEKMAGLGIAILLGWIVADFAIVYLTPDVGRAPAALVIPFAIAATFAGVSAGRPLLAILPSIGGVVALLPVFGEASPPTDVYGTYNTVCNMALAVVVAGLCARTFWPQNDPTPTSV